MDKDRQDDAALEALFAAARTDPPEASDDFLAKLTADAEGAVSTAKTATSPLMPSPFLGGIKGLFAASGLSGAAVLGVWIGFVMPETIGEWTTTTDETVALYTFLPGADLTALSLSE